MERIGRVQKGNVDRNITLKTRCNCNINGRNVVNDISDGCDINFYLSKSFG